ncbi:MAG: hypothetical protein ACHQAX_09980 [Gammaproteobacteria bacterium]
MFNKFCLSLLIAGVSLVGIAQAEGIAQHYFQISPYALLNSPWDWLEVMVKVNGKSQSITFSWVDPHVPYTFPLSEIDMSQKGLIEITEVRYQDSVTKEIYTIPFIDIPACHIEVSQKTGYPNSTLSKLELNQLHCANLLVYPYME